MNDWEKHKLWALLFLILSFVAESFFFQLFAVLAATVETLLWLYGEWKPLFVAKKKEGAT